MATEAVHEPSSPVDADMEDPKLVEFMAEAKKEKANQYYATKQYKEALVGYNAVIELCPHIPKYYGNRAACYMMLGQYQDALNDAKMCILLDPTFYKAYIRVIKCFLILGDILQAEANLKKLIELDPDNKAIHSEKKALEYVQKYLKDAGVAYNAKDYRKVVFCMDRCCDVSRACTNFKLTKAECLAFLGRYREAQEIANDTLLIDKNNADAIYVRGLCLYYQDYVDRAFVHFQQVLRLTPDHAKAFDIYKRAKNLKIKKEEGNAAFKQEQYKKAYKLYTEALEIDPQNIKTNAKLHFNKATISAKLGQTKRSVTECTEALKLDENYLKALIRRSVSYQALEQYEDAVRDLEKLCKLDKSSEYKRLLMEAKLALKKSKRKDYYKILAVNSNASNDDIKKAYRKLAMVHHPDRHADSEEGEKKEQEKKFKEIGEAYTILSDPKKRSRYDCGQDLNVAGGFNDFDPDTEGKTFYKPFRSGYEFQTNDIPGFSYHFG